MQRINPRRQPLNTIKLPAGKCVRKCQYSLTQCTLCVLRQRYPAGRILNGQQRRFDGFKIQGVDTGFIGLDCIVELRLLQLVIRRSKANKKISGS